jgi:hypothetical protein
MKRTSHGSQLPKEVRGQSVERRSAYKNITISYSIILGSELDHDDLNTFLGGEHNGRAKETQHPHHLGR